MDARKEKNEIYEYMAAGWQDYLVGAMYDMERFLGCADAEDAARAERQGRVFMAMNKIKRQIDFLSGHEIKNRHILKIQPVGREDDKGCDQHTGLIMQQMSVYGGYDVLSEAFKYGSLVSGSNLIEIWRDRYGNIRFGRCGFNEFLLMPDFRESDLSDCEHILKAKYLSPDKVEMLLPADAEFDKKDYQNTYGTTHWEYLTKPITVNDKRILFEEWWRRESSYVDTLISNITGQERPYKDFVAQEAGGDGQLVDRMLDTVRLPNGKPAVIKYKKPVDKVKLVLFVNDNPVWEGDNPLGVDDYNFVWLHGNFVPEIDRSDLKLQSFARVLRESARLNDRRMNQAMDIIETQIHSGRIFRDEYIKNPEDAYKAGQAVRIHIKDKDNGGPPLGTPLQEIFTQIPAAEMSASFFKIMEILESTENEIGGLNSDALGQNDDSNTPGILSMFRTGQALTSQQGIFNGYRASKKQLGLKLVKINQANYDPQRVARILGEMPIQSFYDKDFSKFDCVPAEGVLTETQQNLFYLELKELRQMFPDAANVIPMSMLIENSPMQFKDRIKQSMQAMEQKSMQMQQLLANDKQLQQKLIQAQTIQAINKSQAELARAEEDKTDAQLARVKTMVEMQKMGTERNLEVVDRLLRLEQIEQENKKILVSQQKIIADLMKNKNQNRNNRRTKNVG